MDFKNYLEENARKIDEVLDEILSDFLKETQKINIKLLPFALGLINSCKGGKRIRGVLVKLGYEIAGGDFKKDILRIGAALEILHTALLIHDDIMDKSTTRRGKPSLYQSFGGDHYGISQAISVGDIAFYLPIKLILGSKFLDEYKIIALKHLTETVINTGWGQVLDMETSRMDEVTDGDLKFIYSYKTAKYTIAGPLQIGAILAGSSEKLIDILGEFGENLGIAFQIQDNILDGELDSAQLGKQQASEYTLQAKKIIPQITKDRGMVRLLELMTTYMTERTI